ncbi:MAG: PilZ domain-containing protein [Deltaproteobacteria bacterium]|nr:PilZ domain-containing protein [Deltaproteobacteria bacterium]MCW5803756.1 PilZ domain-containing protein [Deltaproteobacteria bacterium]
MDHPRHERRTHFRGKARPGRVLPLRFRAESHSQSHSAWVIAQTRNIGVGGAFIVTQLIQPIGSLLTVEITLPTSDRTFVLAAEVRWAAHDGMGVMFVGVDVDILLEMNDYFATLTGT